MDQTLLNKITDLHSLSTIRSVESIDKGFLSENHKLSTDKGQFFLKRYRFDNESRIKEIHRVKSYFSSGGVPIILPIKNSNKSTYFKYKDAYFAVFPFRVGVQPERGGLSKQMIISMGKMLGKIHLLGKEADLEVGNYFSSWDKKSALDTVEEVENKLDQIKEKGEFDLLAAEAIAFKRKLIEENKIKFEDLDLKNDHLVHGDYLDQNLFFDERDDVMYVFDLEKSGFEPRTRELFRSATYSFLNTDFDERSVDKIRLYLKSYCEVYPVEQRELKNGLTAHYLKSIHSFWVEKEHYLKNNKRTDVFLEPDLKRIKFMSDRLNSLL